MCNLNVDSKFVVRLAQSLGTSPSYLSTKQIAMSLFRAWNELHDGRVRRGLKSDFFGGRDFVCMDCDKGVVRFLFDSGATIEFDPSLDFDAPEILDEQGYPCDLPTIPALKMQFGSKGGDCPGVGSFCPLCGHGFKNQEMGSENFLFMDVKDYTSFKGWLDTYERAEDFRPVRC